MKKRPLNGSWVAMQVAYSVCVACIHAWNVRRHPEPSGGTPIDIRMSLINVQPAPGTSTTKQFLLFTPWIALQMEEARNASLSLQATFGDLLLNFQDPDRSDLIDASDGQRMFNSPFPDLLELFGDTSRGEYETLRSAINHEQSRTFFRKSLMRASKLPH